MLNESHVCKRLNSVTAEQSNFTNYFLLQPIGSLRVHPASTGSFWLETWWMTILPVKTQSRKEHSSLQQTHGTGATAPFGTDGCGQRIWQRMELCNSHPWCRWTQSTKDFQGEEWRDLDYYLLWIHFQKLQKLYTIFLKDFLIQMLNNVPQNLALNTLQDLNEGLFYAFVEKQE